MNKLLTGQIETVKKVGEEKYYEMLECLPPKRQASNGFLVGEPMDHESEDGSPRFQMYVEKLGGFIKKKTKYYYTGLATVKDFEMMLMPKGFN